MPTMLSRKSGGEKKQRENKEKLFHLQKYQNLRDFGPNNNIEHKFLRPGVEDALAAASPACPAPPWGTLGSTFVFPGLALEALRWFLSRISLPRLSSAP